MDYESAKGWVRLLYQLYQHKPLEAPEVRESYIKVFRDYENDIAQSVFDELMKKHKYCPAPSEIFEAFEDARLQIRQAKVFDRTSEIKCYVCMDKGVLGFADGEGRTFVLYCTECDTGKASAYDGSKISNQKYRTNYAIEPLTKYYDRGWISETEQTNRLADRTPKPMPEYVMKLARKHGINLRALMGRG